CTWPMRSNVATSFRDHARAESASHCRTSASASPRGADGGGGDGGTCASSVGVGSAATAGAVVGGGGGSASGGGRTATTQASLPTVFPFIATVTDTR